MQAVVANQCETQCIDYMRMAETTKLRGRIQENYIPHTQYYALN